MKKIINPCRCKVYRGSVENFNYARGFVKIEYTGGRLTLCGVIGPMSNGRCKGDAGQCTDKIREGDPVTGWNREMLDKLCDIWDRWHLNDMRPYCEHQKEKGWDKMESEPITLYHYRLTRQAYEKKKAAEREAIEHLRNGQLFLPTEEQTFFATLPYALDIYDALEEIVAPHYEPKKPLYTGDCGFTEVKTRGWVRFSDTEKGILCKPCPVCGYKYGTSWKKEEVPQEVIDWLFALPDTTVEPAWV